MRDSTSSSAHCLCTPSSGFPPFSSSFLSPSICVDSSKETLLQCLFLNSLKAVLITIDIAHVENLLRPLKLLSLVRTVMVADCTKSALSSGPTSKLTIALESNRCSSLIADSLPFPVSLSTHSASHAGNMHQSPPLQLF